jgi:hypothetical protein
VAVDPLWKVHRQGAGTERICDEENGDWEGELAWAPHEPLYQPGDEEVILLGPPVCGP